MDETGMNSACPGLVPVPLLQGFKFIGSSKYFYQLPMPFEGAFHGPDDGIFGGLTYYRPKQDDGRALGDGYYGYQRVGDLAGGLTLLRTYENPGGNAAADALILVKGPQHDPGEDIEEIVLVAKERFGNRCASGISNVDVPSKKPSGLLCAQPLLILWCPAFAKPCYPRR